MDSLKLENQLCFPLYVCAKEVVRLYRPLLEPLGLTYTQYIAMMVLWEHRSMTVSELGKKLYLDSGTLTPLLKKMEKAGWISRERGTKDERQTIVRITPEGETLKEKAAVVPENMRQCSLVDREDALQLYSLLYRMMDRLNNLPPRSAAMSHSADT